MLEHLARRARSGRARPKREPLAAARDGDVERGLDLAQVLVKRAAQVGEATVVRRGEVMSRGLEFNAGARGVGGQAIVAASRQPRAPDGGPPRRRCRAASGRVLRRSPRRRSCRRVAGVRQSSRRGCCLCARQSSNGCFFEGPSTSTRCTVPTIAAADPLARGARAAACRRCRRARFSSGGCRPAAPPQACRDGGCTRRRTKRRTRPRPRAAASPRSRVGLAGETDDEVRRDRQSPAAPCASAGRSPCIRARCTRASSPRGRGPIPTAPAGARGRRARHARVGVDQPLA